MNALFLHKQAKRNEWMDKWKYWTVVSILKYSFAVQHIVEPPPVAVNSRSLEVYLRTEPPIGNENLVFGQFDSVGHSIHVIAAVNKPSARHFESDGRVAPKTVRVDEIDS